MSSPVHLPSLVAGRAQLEPQPIDAVGDLTGRCLCAIMKA